MFIPFLTPYLTKHPQSEAAHKTLERRRGGGGKGSGSGSGSSGGGGTSGGGSSGGSGRPVSVSNSGSSKGSATAYGNGGGKATTLGAGTLFAGRTAGGGDRSQVYGTRTYGSGYPGYSGYGVAGRGFPFYFWPVAWGGAGLGTGAYLYGHEYGNPDNSSRPGGPMTQISFASASSSSNSTFFVIADNSTTTSLLTSIWNNCTSVISTSASTANNSAPQPYNDTAPDAPKPEQAVQYYRASSVVLTLNGYNDTTALADNVTGPVNDVPLPQNTDQNLLDCLNYTIGAAVPLIDAGVSIRWGANTAMGTLGFVWVILYLAGCLV